MELIATEDSYADRRQLFKDIWDTAMLMEEKEADILNKPKVIKKVEVEHTTNAFETAGNSNDNNNKICNNNVRQVSNLYWDHSTKKYPITTKKDLIEQEPTTARPSLFYKRWQDLKTIETVRLLRTLRLDDDDKFVIGRKKKERIRNLRTVCKKILDYCDRQDADEVLEDQINGIQNPVHHNLKVKPKKLKAHRKKKKITQTKSLHTPTAAKTAPEPETVSPIKPAISDRKENIPPKPGFKYNKTSIIRRTLITNYNVKGKTATEGAKSSTNKTRAVRRKVMKKKHSKRKKPKGSSDDIDVPEEWDKLENAQNKVEGL